MSTNQVSDAARWQGRWQGASSAGYQVTILCDGVGTLTDGLSHFLDARGLFRQGLNIGPTMQNAGTGSIAVLGTLAPANIATHRRSRLDPAQVIWTPVFTLASGAIDTVTPKVYSAFQIQFSGAGQLDLLTL